MLMINESWKTMISKSAVVDGIMR